MESSFNIPAISKKYYGLEVQVKALPGEVDLNYYLISTSSNEYILKIANKEESLAYLDMQNQALLHLEHQHFDFQVPQILTDLEGNHISIIQDAEGNNRYMRLLSWVKGRLWATTKPHSEALVHSLGHASASLCLALSNFDHPEAHRFFKWDIAQTAACENQIDYIEKGKKRTIAQHYLHAFQNIVAPQLKNLRQGLIHNDANDYNLTVSENGHKIAGVLDFGDLMHTQIVNDLAIAIAYAIMNKPEPLRTAATIIKGFHEKYPLEEKEVELLYYLIAARLLISVSNSAQNRHAFPDNNYLLISEKPAWNLLYKWRAIHPDFAYYTFRTACNWDACPQAAPFKTWASKQDFAPLCELGTKLKYLDCSVSSTFLGHNTEFLNQAAFQNKIEKALQGFDAGIGYYKEVRPFYSSEAYKQMGNNGPQWRSMHLGLDIFLPAESPVFATCDAIVHSLKDNAADFDYGPTIILKHQADDFSFYTLYGHLSRASLKTLHLGQAIKKGQQIARLGPAPENGNWPPHLHFQILLNLFDYEGDFPGVAFPHEADLWTSISPNPKLISGIDCEAPKEETPSKIIQARKQYFAKNLSLSYQQPLKMDRGYMQYLYDHTGRRYLDTVNNVPHVGHQHLRVVQAAQQQVAVLNTNTRYLHKNLVAYAEALSATLPSPLDVCFFVNSGSEANELALRLAQTYTKEKDMLVIETGYHGNTNACIDISSYKFDSKGGQGAAKHIHKLPMPDSFRGLYRTGSPDIGIKYAAFAESTIQELSKQSKKIAGFIGESILSCGGQIVPPQNYFKEVFKHVRSAGGLCILDEVQVGLGRVGDTFWGFQLQDVVPDIVTMGKPIGNGHPLGVVVTSRKIADAFANGMEYFNTFGGNPVSCAIGHEVLKIVQEENLQIHAKNMGDFLKDELHALSKEFPIIADVRGHGLFLGFELISSPLNKIPAAAATAYLANRMRELGILMSIDGPDHNVIKIKPPLAFQQNDAEFLLEQLRKVFAENAMQL